MYLENYLRKINITHRQQPTPLFLQELQTHHILNIPWENLNVFFKKEISLEPQVIIKKFIEENRGGLCFELNGAYHHLLVDLGFNATLVSARIFGFNDKKYQTPRDTHIVILVECNHEMYLTDVSWDGFRTPLALSGEIAKDITGFHRIVKGQNHNYYVEKKIAETWHIQYQFFFKKIKLTELSQHLDYQHADPEREAASQLLYLQHMVNGCISLINDKIIFQENNAKKEYTVAELGGLAQCLTKTFKVAPHAVKKLLNGRL
jgi:N-hydroxyarylamine O-acetyltransferase